MKRWILYIVLGLIVFFIWDNSLQNGGSSDGFSLIFAEKLAPIAHNLGFHGNIWALNRIVLGMGIAILDEFIQIFSPGRSSQFSDVVIDTIGVVIGIFLVKLVYRIGQKKSIYKK